MLSLSGYDWLKDMLCFENCVWVLQAVAGRFYVHMNHRLRKKAGEQGRKYLRENLSVKTWCRTVKNWVPDCIIFTKSLARTMVVPTKVKLR